MAPIECLIQAEPIHPWELRQTLPRFPACGGLATFEGLIRDVNEGRRVIRLEYESYDELAIKELRRICEAVAARFNTAFIRVVHRKGFVAIGETAVMIQVLTSHRREAFAACRMVIDQLKALVPIWKREVYDDGTHAWTRCHEHEHA